MTFCPEWNLLFYTFTDNELETGSFADLAKLTALDIAVPLDSSGTAGSRFFKAGFSAFISILLDTSTLGSYHITINGDPYQEGNMIMTRVPNQNMSKVETLETFVRSSLKGRESKRIALILGGHGAGWFLQTERDSILPVPQFAETIERCGLVLDLLCFDNCMMSNLETMYAIRRIAKTVIAYEDYAGLNGFIQPLTVAYFNECHFNTERIAISIAKNLMATLTEKDIPTDVSVIDIKHIEKLFEFLNMHKLKRPDHKNYCIDQSYWHLQDLYSVCEASFDSEDFIQFKELFNAVVLYYHQSINKSNPYHHGLSCMIDMERDTYDINKAWKLMPLLQ